jgi:hypothetical protein
MNDIIYIIGCEKMEYEKTEVFIGSKANFDKVLIVFLNYGVV